MGASGVGEIQASVLQISGVRLGKDVCEDTIFVAVAVGGC